MRIRKLGSVAALAVALALAVAVGAASALRSISLGARIITKLGTEVTFSAAEGEIRFRIICEVGMTKTISNPMDKLFGSSAGRAVLRVLGQEAERERCREGTARFLMPEATRAVTFIGFGGELPNITRIHLSIRTIEVLITALGGLARCLYIGNLEDVFLVNAGTTRELEVFEILGLSITLRGSLTCPRQLTVSGFLSGGAVRVVLV